MSEAKAWLREYDAARRACDDAAALVADRAAQARQGTGAAGGARAAASARRKLAGLDDTLTALQKGLDNGAGNGSVTGGEKDRRQRLVDELRGRARQMKEMLKAAADDRTALLGGSKDGGVAGGSSSSSGGGIFADAEAGGAMRGAETENTAALTNEQILRYQDDVMRDQDDMLDELHKSVRSTKNIAIAVNDELDLQARLLDDLDSQVEQSQSNLQNATRKLSVLFKKTRGSWKSLCLIMMLIIGLIVVLLFALNVI